MRGKPKDRFYESGVGREIDEPPAWDYIEGDTRRIPVIDHNTKPPRVIRFVAYRKCMSCGKPFLSRDVVKLRLCDMCKAKGSS